MIRRVLTRIPIPRGQLMLYKALYEAGRRGLTTTELADRILRKNRDELAGILGALGHRINGTDGIESECGIELLFDVDKSNGETHYHMRPVLRHEIDEHELLKKELGCSMGTLFEEYAEKPFVLRATRPSTFLLTWNPAQPHRNPELGDGTRDIPAPHDGVE